MVFQLFSVHVLILAYILSVHGLAIPTEVSSLGKRSDGFLKLDFVVNKGSVARRGTLSKRYPTSPLTNVGVAYDLTLNFGTDGQPITVSIDTGSSDLWVPSVNLTSGGYDGSKSSDYNNTGEPFGITYVKGNAEGTWVTDLVTIPNGPSLQNFQFADVITEYEQSTGVLGVGYTSGEAIVGDEDTYPNFPVALKNAGIIKKTAYSLYLNDADATTGSIIFGGYDTEKFSGSLVSLPILGAPQQGLTVNLDSLTLSNGSEVTADVQIFVDSGTTLTYLPWYVVSAIASAAGLNYNASQEIVSDIECDTKLNGTLGFNFDNVTVKVPLQSLVFSYNGTCQFGIAGDLNSGGSDFLGDTFLRHAYVVYNLDDNVIDIAQAKYTSASNIVAIT